ncbi:MAG: YafY family transcriptional regulator [Rhizobiales bacterium]|nr:YafY family transcriptional regulator [Hyphomicrobiales bacterium]
MSRAGRLLELLQALRRRRAPAQGAELARELGVSLRTLYRDIDALRAQGASIDASAGVGFVLRPGFMLPPLMFDADEIDALALGLRWVATQPDAALAAGAREALAKITAALPKDRGEAVDRSPLLAPGRAPGDGPLPAIREAIARGRKLDIAYRDGRGGDTERRVWPIVVGFFDDAQVLAAWCELRGDFRHFRLDRIARAKPNDERPDQPALALRRAWQRRIGLAADRN